MSHKPVAAGKSSFDLVDHQKVFSLMDVQPGSTFLDMACGAGRYSLAIAERVGAGGWVYAVDLWKDGIEVLEEAARGRGIENIQTLVADISDKLPLGSGSIDACLIATVLHDLSEDAQHTTLQEAARLLRPGGMLNIIEFKKTDRGPGPPVARKLDEGEVESLVGDLGFTKVAGSGVGEFTYLVKYQKGA